jgi:DNA-binding NarL/FixJ family response regulator
VTDARPCGPVLVVDDDDCLRAHVLEVLSEAGFATAGAGSGDDALALARETPPAAAVVDVCLPGLSGYEVCRALKEARPETPVIFISGERIESFDRVAGLLIGGDDYLVKPFAHDELLARLRTLLRRSNGVGTTHVHGLTPRELEVLRHLADGVTQAQISELLVISPKTVGTHIEHVFRKLGVRSRAQAVAVAYRRDLVA